MDTRSLPVYFNLLKYLDKCEGIAMDFVTGLPRTQKSYDFVWVIIDRFTKSAHFLPVKNIDGQIRQVYQIVYYVIK